MSDDDDFMQESDEEYDFEYEDDDEEEDGDVDTENKYYNAKQMKLNDAEGAIAEFLGIPPLEKEKGEWGFKGLKQAVKLEYKLGKYDEAADHYAELLTYVSSSITRNYAEKSVNNLLSYIETGATDGSPAAQQCMNRFYSLTLESFQGSNNERLWLKTNLKLGKLLLDTRDYTQLANKIKEMKAVCGGDAAGESNKNKGTYLLEVLALELQMHEARGDVKLLKDTYRRAIRVSSAVPHPRIMGIIRECGGKMFMSESNWSAASRDFSDAFKNFDEAGSLQRIAALRYMLLTTMLMQSDINPFDSPEAKPYKNDPRIKAMVELVEAWQRDDVHAYQKVLQREQEGGADGEILGDPFIAENIDEITRSLVTKGVIRLIKPYTRIRLSSLARQLRTSEAEIQDIIGFLITDSQVLGTLDQETGILTITDPADAARTEALGELSKSIADLTKELVTHGDGFRLLEQTTGGGEGSGDPESLFGEGSGGRGRRSGGRRRGGGRDRGNRRAGDFGPDAGAEMMKSSLVSGEA